MTNAAILRIDQTATASRQVLSEGNLVVWTADLPGNGHALAAFNLGEQAMALDRAWPDFALAGTQSVVQNAWTGERLQASARVTTTLEPHASIVLMLGQ